jgi:hypothetical protein
MVSYGSKKQTSMALSNMESKYMALSKAIAEAICCKDCYKTLVFLNMILPQFLLTSVMAFTMNPKFHNHNVHIDT